MTEFLKLYGFKRKKWKLLFVDVNGVDLLSLFSDLDLIDWHWMHLIID